MYMVAHSSQTTANRWPETAAVYRYIASPDTASTIMPFLTESHCHKYLQPSSDLGQCDFLRILPNFLVSKLDVIQNTVMTILKGKFELCLIMRSRSGMWG